MDHLVNNTYVNKNSFEYVIDFGNLNRNFHNPIDLRDYHFDRDDPVELTGDWQFYWQQLLNPGEDPSKRPELVTMPHLWNEDARYDHFGFGTYQLSILLPKDSPPLALTIPDMYTAYKLFFNGELIASNGIVGSDEESSTPRWEPLTIPLDNTDDRSVEILLQISNFDHSKGGIRLPIIIGRQDRLLHDRGREIFDNIVSLMLYSAGPPMISKPSSVASTDVAKHAFPSSST